MDNVFQEEQIKLAEIESKIDSIASRYENKAKELQSEISDFYCIDYEDVQRKQELIQNRSYVLRLAEQFRAYQPSPYFGRLDLDQDDSDESTTFYIGKEGISDSSKVIVVDWRTPLGSCYYASNQKNFRVNGTDYLLALRRAIDVKNGVLVNYRTEYDGETVSLEGDVIDPFLLTVLKDKRRHNRLTDIIRTIQGNQNEIIRKPRSESFVVQGCAGSGKTMILLHRLSFLKFNNRNMSLTGVKIITPNKFFDAHINDLSVELGLTAIARFSVEEYYVTLIKKYSNKISVDADVRSEKTLSSALLTEIYSLEYLKNSISHYHEYWEQILTQLDENKLRDYFKKFAITYPDTTTHKATTVSQLELAFRQMETAISAAAKKRKEVAQRIGVLSKEIEAVQAELDRSHAVLFDIRGQTVSRIELDASASELALQNLERKVTEAQEARNELQSRRKQADAELQQASGIINVFSRGASDYWKYDRFALRNDVATQIIRKEFASLIREITEADQAYQKTPVYNFGKRNSLRKQIAEQKEIFSRDVAVFVKSLHSNAEKTSRNLRSQVEALGQGINDASDRIKEAEKEIKTQQNRLAAFNECLEIFRSSDMPDTQSSLTLAAHKVCASILTTYEEQRSVYNRISRRMKSFEISKQDLEKEQKQLLQSQQYTEEDSVYVADSAKTLKKLQLSEISRSVMFRDLLNCYKIHEQQYQKANYRHKIYLKLLYCSLYFTRTTNPDTFLNIDEAQDISIAEYHLLRMVLGEKCVFNLYGDINQSVYSYKGITDWDEIADITAGNVYVLNENYRNTLQITEFCNKEFEAEVYPIGISGEDVLEASTADAVKWILDLKTANPDFRVAVIHRHGLKAVQERLRTLLDKQDVSWYSVDDKKLSVLSVETAKGLEFEAVVAIVDQMSNNEKYISYTRALDRLSVVRDKFSAELEVDEVAEGIDDEFVVADEEVSEEQLQMRQDLVNVLATVLEAKGMQMQHALTNVLAAVLEANRTWETLQDHAQEVYHQTGHFFSWEVLNDTVAIKTCDKSFFEYNESGVPKDISWFFDSGNLQRGESKPLNVIFENESYTGKVSCDSSDHSRIRISWDITLGEMLSRYRDSIGVRAAFRKISDDTYHLAMAVNETKGVPIEVENDPDFTGEPKVYSREDYALIAELDSVLAEYFGPEYKLSPEQQSIVLALHHGKSVACNAPSGSMKNVMLYLLALREHQISGKQTLLTAEAHLQENELVLADKLGLKGGIINTMEEFTADFKKEKYDVIFVSYDFFKQHEDVGSFVDYFADKVAYWGLDHPASEEALWPQLNNYGVALEAVMFLMEKTGFSSLDLSNYQRIDIAGITDMDVVKKHTLFAEEEKLKWLLENLSELSGQGLIYCNDEATCKVLGKQLRKAKIMAEAYIDVTNPDKKERINYLTNSFSSGGLPVLVTTQNAGKNLSNPHIRFVVHYDMPVSRELYKLHVTQIGKLAVDGVVHDLQVM